MLKVMRDLQHLLDEGKNCADGALLEEENMDDLLLDAILDDENNDQFGMGEKEEIDEDEEETISQQGGDDRISTLSQQIEELFAAVETDKYEIAGSHYAISHQRRHQIIEKCI